MYNQISAADGDDEVQSYGSFNEIHAGNGQDIIYSCGCYNSLNGGNGDDSLHSTGTHNTLKGGDGNDLLMSSGSDNIIIGESGDDILISSGSSNTLEGGEGSDTLASCGNHNQLSGNEGADSIKSNGCFNKLNGGDGNDNLNSQGTHNLLQGDLGDDKLISKGSDNEMTGGSGCDELVSTGDHNILHGDNKTDNGQCDAGDNELDLHVSDLILSHQTDIRIDFISEGAGYQNTVGYYLFNEDGSIIEDSAGIVWLNASESDGELLDVAFGINQEASYTIEDVPAGVGIGFFLVADAATNSANQSLYQEAANELGTSLYDINESVSITPEGQVLLNGQAISGNTYFSHDTSLNSDYESSDGIEHNWVNGQLGDGGLLIGFEDLYNGGDEDYDDIVLAVELGEENVFSLTHDCGDKGNHDILNSIGDHNFLFGEEGDDTLASHGDHNTLSGGTGNDTLVSTGMSNLLDGGCGDDVLISHGCGSTLDGGAGNDSVTGGNGQDIGIYHFGENQGYTDEYDGGEGCDTLVLNFTHEQAANLASELGFAGIDELISALSSAFDNQTEEGIDFAEFGFNLKATSFEHLDIQIDDHGDNLMEASLIELGTGGFSGSLEQGSDVDIFKCMTDGPLTFSINAESDSNCDIDLLAVLRDIDGNVLAMTDVDSLSEATLCYDSEGTDEVYLEIVSQNQQESYGNMTHYNVEIA